MTDKLDWNDYFVARGDQATREALLGAVNDSSMNDPPPKDERWKDQFKRTKDGTLKTMVFNLRLILQNEDWGCDLAYCDFSYRIIKRQARGRFNPGEWTDADKAFLRDWFGSEYGLNPGDKDLSDAVLMVAKLNSFHPVREYLESLRWDGTPRLNDWLDDCLGGVAHNPDYLSVVGRKFLIGAVARILRSPCKMDNVLILEGAQGRGKSTAIHALFGEWFSDAPIPIGDKDAYQNIQGVWCSELAELDSFNKAESTASKLFFSQVRDRFRPSYGHNAQDFPRQCVFVGTTNQDEYLKDYTGNRRYWPVKCDQVRVDLIKSNRDQMWAEAVVAFNRGEAWWIDREEDRAICEQEQEDRLQRDPWEYRIADWLRACGRQHVTSYEILTEVIEMDSAHIQKMHQMRLSPIMKSLGWDSKRVRVVQPNGKSLQVRAYVRPKA